MEMLESTSKHYVHSLKSGTPLHAHDSLLQVVNDSFDSVICDVATDDTPGGLIAEHHASILYMQDGGTVPLKLCCHCNCLVKMLPRFVSFTYC